MVFHVEQSDVYYSAMRKEFPDGSSVVLCADRPCFRAPGWEREGGEDDKSVHAPTPESEKIERSRRRARAAVSDICLANPDMDIFVTLTLDQSKIDRYSVDEQLKSMKDWLSNRVRRNGLKYVLVPEFHKDGRAIHYHGLFNRSLEMVDSGTITLPGVKSPRRPRSNRQREEWIASGGHIVYNLPSWSYGFSTGIELYGERGRALAYVCKYIGKSGKIGGRYYYSGGALDRPVKSFFNADWDDVSSGLQSFSVPRLGANLVKFEVDTNDV